MLAYHVEVNGEEARDLEKIREVSQYLAEKATTYFDLYEKLSKKERAEKFLEWQAYQAIDFFKLAQMDWKPTKEMLQAIQGKKFPQTTVMKTFPAYEEFIASRDFEVYWLKDLYT